MENSRLVQNKVDELNRNEPGSGLIGAPTMPIVPPWIAVTGYFALTSFSNQTTPSTFNPSSGYVVKIFVNTRNGEMKIYPFQLFET